MRDLTRDEEAQLGEVMRYAIYVARQYFKAGTDIGEATRGRVVEAIARNWTQRGHLTERREVHTICRRCYADEIRNRFGNPTARAKRGHHGVWVSLLDDAEEAKRKKVAGFGFHVAEANDGGIGDVIDRVSAQQDADVLAREVRKRGAGTNVSPATAALVLEYLATCDGPLNVTMQDIADDLGVSKATISRAVRYIQQRRMAS